MIRSFLVGVVGGMRSMTPLAAVAIAASHRALPRDDKPTRLLGHPAVVAGTLALAAGELAGDKWKKAPDRIVPAGLAARLVTGAITGAALARRDQRALGAALGVAGAMLSAYVTFGLRMRAMEQHGQTSTGLVEDAAVMTALAGVVGTAAARPDHRLLR